MGRRSLPALVQVEKLTGVKPKEAFVDQGFRGRRSSPGRSGSLHQWQAEVERETETIAEAALMRREPVIGHGKHDHGMGRNYLRGEAGDRMNALLSGCGFNLRKLWRFFAAMPLINAEALA